MPRRPAPLAGSRGGRTSSVPEPRRRFPSLRETDRRLRNGNALSISHEKLENRPRDKGERHRKRMNLKLTNQNKIDQPDDPHRPSPAIPDD